MKPLDFLVVGATKSGTTALFHYLCDHPSIVMPPTKEAPFFSKEHHWAKGWDAFAEVHFRGANPSSRWGKITPVYWEKPGVPGRIRSLMPDVRLVALLRHPVERAHSDYRYAVRMYGEDRDFAEAFFDSERRYVRASLHGANLKRYLEQFPKEQMLVLFTEDLAKDPESALNDLMIHIELEPGYEPPNLGKRYNVGGTRKRHPWLQSLRRRAVFHRLVQLLPLRLRERIKFWYFTEKDVRREDPPQLSTSLREGLVDYFRSDVGLLRTLLGVSPPWPEWPAET